MRLTTPGKYALFLLFLALWNAMNGGLNLLYLLAGTLVAAFLVALLALRFLTRRIAVTVELPEQLFAEEETPLLVTVRNEGMLPAFGLTLATHARTIPVGDLGRGEARTIRLPYRFARRGRTVLTDLAVEVRFPFGLLVRRRFFPIRDIVVFPAISRDVEARRSRDIAQEEVARPRRGAGDEFWGIREYVLGDDVRLISWKLTAKLGRPLIREYAEMVGDRVVVRVSGNPPGPETERRIREAAAVARFFIDEGSEVRLITDEADTGFGRGLLHLGIILRHLALLGEGKRAHDTGPVAARRQTLAAIGERGLLHTLTFLLAAVTAAGLWLVEGLDPITRAIVPAAVIAGWAFDHWGRHPIPAWLLNVLNIVVIIAVLAIDIPMRGLLPGLTHLLAYAFVNRMISPKGARDTGTIFLICFLLFLLVSWQTVEPLYFVAYAAFVAVALAWVAGASEGATRLGLRRIAALGVVLIFLLAATGLIFTATPRLENPRFVRMMRQLGLASMVLSEFSIVELADRVELGAFDRVRENSRRVLQVRIAGLEDGSGRSLLVRGGALDQFDGRRWRRSELPFRYRLYGREVESTQGRGLYGRAGEAGPEGERFVTEHWRPDLPADDEIVQEFYLYPMRLTLLFSAGDPTVVEGSIAQPMFDLSGTAYAASPFTRGGRYIVRSQSIPIRLYTAVEEYPALARGLFLQLPEGMERVAALAGEATAGATSPLARANALEQYFHENFQYSYLGAHGRQSLEEFLFETRAANCEYFATAMTIMLRAQGVPARLVVGYLAQLWQQVGGYFDVRNSDGHAWVEAFIPDRGWVAFDPTPEARRRHRTVARHPRRHRRRTRRRRVPGTHLVRDARAHRPTTATSCALPGGTLLSIRRGAARALRLPPPSRSDAGRLRAGDRRGTSAAGDRGGADRIILRVALWG